MKRVAKLILIDQNGHYLLLRRSNHPSFPYDSDLPGGTLEEAEEPIPGLIREVSEETGLALDIAKLEKMHESNKYDEGHVYYLYKATYENESPINISWEHDSFEWLTRDDFIIKIHEAVDKYMRMVYDYLSENDSRPSR